MTTYYWALSTSISKGCRLVRIAEGFEDKCIIVKQMGENP